MGEWDVKTQRYRHRGTGTKVQAQRYRHRGATVCGDGGRDGRDATTAKEHLELQTLEEARKPPPLKPLEGAWLCGHLDCRLLASRTGKG